MPTMLLAATIVGRSIVKLLPYRLRPIGKLYFSPLLGLAVFVLIAIVTGWITPFSRWISTLELLVAVALSLFFLRKDLKWSPFVRYALLLFGFSLVASIAISSPLISFNGYNPFDDTFTYLVHGQWLQTHAFSERISGSGYFPAMSQITLYQSVGARMGGSFFLGWVQSIFGLQWSYSAYSAVIAVPYIAGALAISGAVNYVVRGSRKIALLSGLVAATAFSGLTYGVTNGFFPQTFGLAFAIGGMTLFAALIHESRRINQFRQILIYAIPISILFAAFAFSYNDMLPFIVLGLVGFLLYTVVLHRQNTKGVMLSSAVVFFQTILLINVEFVRVLKNVVGVLGVGSGSHAIGYPIRWNPFEFLTFSFGFSTTYGEYWAFGKYILPVMFVALFLGILYFVTQASKQKLSKRLLVHVSILSIYFLTFLYFRYGANAVHPDEIGHSFLQFKLAKWAGPFSFVLMGSAIAFLTKKFRTKILAGLMGLLIIYGAVGHFEQAKNSMQGFVGETGYDRTPFNALLRLREKVKKIDPDEVVYLNFGPEHHKLRQMVAYILPDRKLASDYTDDGYITGQMPPEHRKMPINIADWVIELGSPNERRQNTGTGNIVVKKTSEMQEFTLIKVSGGYARETDGASWWYWASKSLVFEYEAMKNKLKEKKAKLKFTYLPTVPNKTLKIKVAGKEALSVKMAEGWQEVESKPIDVGHDKLVIEFTSNGKPVRASDNDPRMVSFMIKNLELVKVR